MAPLACYLHDSGHSVTGSDHSSPKKNPRIKYLLERGIEINPTHSQDLSADIHAVCYSSAINIKKNPGCIAATKKNIPLVHRSKLLAEVASTKKLIAISGTHGKTTTSALAAQLLVGLGVDLSVIIGAQTKEMPVGCRFGQSEYLLIEADESDRSFLNYRPFINVIHNITEDHMDQFRDFAHIEDTFAEYANQTLKDGVCLLGWDHKEIRKFSEKVLVDFKSYGFNIGTEVRCYQVTQEGPLTHYKIMADKQKLEGCFPLSGNHNIQNLLAAISIVKILGLDVSKVVDITKDFSPIHRRSELIGTNNSCIVIDDYAHNPDKISAFCSSISNVYPEHNIIAIYQPHRISRYNLLFEKFIESFKGCHYVGVLPIYSAGEKINLSHPLSVFVDRMKLKSRVESVEVKDFDDSIQFIKSNVGDKNVIITLGAGDINHLGPLICKSLNMGVEDGKKKIKEKV